MEVNKRRRPKQRRPRKQRKDVQASADSVPVPPAAHFADAAAADGNPPPKARRANPRRRQATPPAPVVSPLSMAPAPVVSVPSVAPTKIAAAQSRGWQYLARAGCAFRGHPRAAGLAITTVLSCVTLALAVTLSRIPSPESMNTTSEGDAAVSQVAQSRALAGTPMLEPPRSEPETEQTGTASPEIRIVDLPMDKLGSCQDNVWPYIDSQCRIATKDLTADKADAKTARKTETKIGPRPIDARRPSHPSANPQVKDIPIGSMTAIIPASPKVAATDGVGKHEMDQPASEPGPVVIVRPKKESVPTVPAANTTKFRKSANRHRVGNSAEETKTEQPQRQMTVDRNEQPQRQVTIDRRKKHRHVVETRRKPSSRRAIAETREMQPRFFFPFGWFTQLR